MKATYFAAAAAVALAGMSGTAHAAFTISEVHTGTPTADLTNFPTPNGGSTGEFTLSTTGTDLGPPAQRRSPYQGNTAVNETTASYSVLGEGGGDGTATYNISGSFLQILWGSPDTTGGSGGGKAGDESRNFIWFFSGGQETVVTALDLQNASIKASIFDEANFNPPASTASGWAWAKITIDGGFDSFQLVHENNAAFEYDGFAVPLPAAAWLMIGGLSAVGAYARRSRKTVPTA